MFVIRDREAGNYITAVETYEEALEMIEEYEEEDKKEDSYTENFYEIVEAEPEVLFGDLQEDGVEVGIGEDGLLYIADDADVERTLDTPENRKKFIKMAEDAITEWQSGR